MSCENCGLPEGVTGDKGLKVPVTRRAENGYQRDRKAVVWTCCQECAVQVLGVAMYGNATHKWPVTLAQFRATRPLRGLDE